MNDNIKKDIKIYMVWGTVQYTADIEMCLGFDKNLGMF
jgi:hypothetical protein